VAPNVPSSFGQLRGSPLLNDQYLERRDRGRVQSPHSPARPTTQVTITYPANLRQSDASRVLSSSRTGTSSTHHPTSCNTDQQHGPNSNRTASSREVSLKQCELLSLLLNYLFPRNGERVEESIVLHSLEQVWGLPLRGLQTYRKKTLQRSQRSPYHIS